VNTSVGSRIPELSRWQPDAELHTLRARAKLLTEIRRWCATQSIIEIDAPLLSASATTDPQIESYAVAHAAGVRYLRTSAEFHLKRLLAAGIGDCYDLGRVFRYAEYGRYHNPEFTMLEWYRLGMDQHQMIADVAQLLECLHGEHYPGLQKRSYRSVVQDTLGIDLLNGSTASLAASIESAGVQVPETIRDARDELLDLAMSTCIAERLPRDRYTCIYDYPASQASLARLDTDADGWPVASRFEIYFGSLELANGFHELTDAEEQQRRFEHDNQQREARGQSCLPYDRALVDALANGLPDCAGVAIGVDRLFMALNPQLSTIQQGMAFGWANA